MYSKAHNLILGFHGCSLEVFESVVRQGGELLPSTNDYDWLGNGVYFWEGSEQRAAQWAHDVASRKRFTPAVIGAVIDLGRCLDLTESACIELLANEYRMLEAEYDLLGMSIPQNAGKTQDKLLRRLDCAVIEHLHKRLDGAGSDGFDSARGLFTEGGPAYPGAGFTARAHTQLCIRNPNCILGYFEPRRLNDSWPRP